MKLFRTGFATRLPIAAAIGLTASLATAATTEIPYTKTVLDNGLTVIVHEDSKAPIVAVNIWYHVGSKNETPGRTGFAHLFEHLMFQGSENFDDEYLRALQELGATDWNATTWFDRTNYFETVPKNALDTVLWMESDRMGHFLGAVSQDKLDEQRGVVQNEKRQRENQPYGRVWEHIQAQVFPAPHPYSWETIGSMEDLDAATLDDIREWFETYYGPNNAVLAIAGDIDTDDAIARAEKFFGDIPPGPPVARAGEWIPVHAADRRMIMEDRVPQSRIYKVWTGPRWGTRDAHLMSLAAAILSEGKNSRLYQRLVYDDQIATDIVLAAQPLEIAGATYLIATAPPGAGLTEIEATAAEEIGRFIARGPTRKELARAKIRHEARFLRGIERVGGSRGKAGILAESEVYGGSPDRYRQMLDDIDTARREDVRRVAERWLGGGAFVMEVHPHPELSAAAAGADRNARPAPGPLPDARFPKFTRQRLDNGLNVITVVRPGNPVVELSMTVDAGYAADQFAAPGTAKFAMTMLDEGTRKRNALEISDELAMQGAVLAAGSNLDSSFVQMSALRSRLDDSLELFADVTLNPVFPADELERVRQRWLAQIQREKTEPLSMALRVLPGLLYGSDHAYGQPMTGSGTEAAIAAVTRDDLAHFHQTWFRPNRATLIAVGDIDSQRFAERVEALFGDWSPGEVPDKSLGVDHAAPVGIIHVVDRPNAQQSIVFAGQLLPPIGGGRRAGDPGDERYLRRHVVCPRQHEPARRQGMVVRRAERDRRRARQAAAVRLRARSGRQDERNRARNRARIGRYRGQTAADRR